MYEYVRSKVFIFVWVQPPAFIFRIPIWVNTLGYKNLILIINIVKSRIHFDEWRDVRLHGFKLIFKPHDNNLLGSCLYFREVGLQLATFIAKLTAKRTKQAIVVKQTILIWQKGYALPSHLTLLKCIQYEQCNRNVLNWIFLCSQMWCAIIYHTFRKCVLSSLLGVLKRWGKKSWQSLLE